MLIDKSKSLCIIGSCFGVELRLALKKRGWKILPEGDRYDGLVDRLVWYHTYSMLYEFKRVFEDYGTNYENIWHNTNGPREGYQEPSRRLVIADTRDEVIEVSEQIDAEMKEAILTADAFLIMPTLTEIWSIVTKSSGEAGAWKVRGIHEQRHFDRICTHPVYSMRGTSSGAEEFIVEFKTTRRDEDASNLRTIWLHARSGRPEVQVILGVCPVPLRQTYTDKPLALANWHGKLRLSNVMKAQAWGLPGVYYLPVLEEFYGQVRKLSPAVIPNPDFFSEDRRHVLPRKVEKIADMVENYEENYE